MSARWDDSSPGGVRPGAGARPPPRAEGFLYLEFLGFSLLSSLRGLGRSLLCQWVSLLELSCEGTAGDGTTQPHSTPTWSSADRAPSWPAARLQRGWARGSLFPARGIEGRLRNSPLPVMLGVPHTQELRSRMEKPSWVGRAWKIRCCLPGLWVMSIFLGV